MLARQVLAAAESGVKQAAPVPQQPPNHRVVGEAPEMDYPQRGRWVLALVAGQTPRPELTNPLRTALAGVQVDVVEVGALDGTSEEQLRDIANDQQGPFLLAELSDGRSLRVSENALTPLLQVRLSTAVVYSKTPPMAAMLLCMASLPKLRAPPGMLLVRPFECTLSAVSALGLSKAVLLVPSEVQKPYSEARWLQRMPHLHIVAVPLSTTMPLEEMERIAREMAEPGRGVLIQDFVGSPAVATGLRNCLPGRFVLDTGALAFGQLVALLR